MATEDTLEQLSRLAGVRASASRTQRSIFDDPDDLDELEDDADFEASFRVPMLDRLPELIDLAADAQQRIRRFAIEERLERGLPPIELLELYRGVELVDDEERNSIWTAATSSTSHPPTGSICSQKRAAPWTWLKSAAATPDGSSPTCSAPRRGSSPRSRSASCSNA